MGASIEPHKDRDLPEGIPSALIDCEQAELFMSRQIDGELTAADLPILQAHLQLCRTCREQAVHWTDQSDLLSHSLNKLTPAADKERRVARAATRTQFKPTIKSTRAYALPAGMVAAQMLTLAGLFFFLSGTAQAPKTARNAAVPQPELRLDPAVILPLPEIAAVKKSDGVEVSLHKEKAIEVILKDQIVTAPQEPIVADATAPASVASAAPVASIPAIEKSAPLTPALERAQPKEIVMAAMREQTVPKLLRNISTQYSIEADVARGIVQEHGRIEILGDVLAGKAVIRLSDAAGNVKEVAQPDIATVLKAPHRQIVERFIVQCLQPALRKRIESAQ